MKNKHISIRFIVLLGLIVSSFVAAATEEKYRVVFSGHSLTDSAVPTVINIAKDNKDDFESIYQSIPGSTIRYRTRGASPKTEHDWNGYGIGVPGGLNLIDEIRNPKELASGEFYNRLVITERHDLLSTIQWERTESLILHFHKLLLEKNPQSKTYVYHSWLDVNKNSPADWIEYEKKMASVWNCLGTKLNMVLKSEGKPEAIKVIPAGWALATLLDRMLSKQIYLEEFGILNPAQDLFRDSVHLTELGDLFIGAYTYSAITNRSPERTIIPFTIDRELGERIVSLAWKIFQEGESVALGKDLNMQACRDWVKDNACELMWSKIRKEPKNIQSCKNFYGKENARNPFRWPDPDLITWPSPK